MSVIRHSKGLTLVELMVSLVIGSLLILGLLTMMNNASQAGRQLLRSATQSENARYAADLLQAELSMAGFMGELPLQSIRHVSSANTPYTELGLCAGSPLGAMAYDGAGTPPLKVPVSVQGISPDDGTPCLPDRMAGTAAILIQRLATDLEAAGTTGTAWVAQYSYCEKDPDTRLTLSNDVAQLTLRDRDCKAISPVRRHLARIYYVARCNQCNDGGDGTPTLKRAELSNGQWVRTGLVEGIEYLQFEFGFDVDNNGSPDLYRTEPGAPDQPEGTWGNVMAVRTHFVARSEAKDAGASKRSVVSFKFGDQATFTPVQDGYIRQGFSLLTRLINPSAARE